MHIAVIGGGIAGLSCAWRLGEAGHQVTLFEAADTLGGHATTIDVPSADGQPQPCDMGFIVYQPWIYPNVAALFALLGVATEPTGPQGVSVSWPGGFWSNVKDSDFGREVAAEIDRFEGLLPSVIADPLGHAEITIRQFLVDHGFSEAFIHRVYEPCAAGRYVTPRGVLDVSVLDAAAAFGPAQLYCLSRPTTTWRTVTGGSRVYIDALATRTRARVRCGCPVRSVTRHGDRVTVRSETYGDESFDQVVLATPANVAFRLLADPSDAERLLLADIRYDPGRQYLHGDTSILPDDTELWCADTYVTSDEQVPFQSASMSWYQPTNQTWLTGHPTLTVGLSEGTLDEAKVYATRDWEHLVADDLHLLRSAELHRIQGVRRTWFAGEYAAVFNGHEGALNTGLAIAEALGATYPFADDAAARRLYYDNAVEHMRVVDRAPVESTDTWWPLTLGRINRQLMAAIAEREVRAELRQRIPAPLWSPLSPLRWVEGPLARFIARRISLYEASLASAPPAPGGAK